MDNTNAVVDKTSEIEPGGLYSIDVRVKGKFDVKNVSRVIGALRFGEGVNDALFSKLTGWWQIQDVEVVNENWNNFVPTINTGASEEYHIIIKARKTNTGTPVLIAVGVILALLIIFVGVLGWNATRLKDLADDTLFNPVFIVGAVLIAFFIWGRK